MSPGSMVLWLMMLPLASRRWRPLRAPVPPLTLIRIRHVLLFGMLARLLTLFTSVVASSDALATRDLGGVQGVRAGRETEEDETGKGWVAPAGVAGWCCRLRVPVAANRLDLAKHECDGEGNGDDNDDEGPSPAFYASPRPP